MFGAFTFALIAPKAFADSQSALPVLDRLNRGAPELTPAESTVCGGSAQTEPAYTSEATAADFCEMPYESVCGGEIERMQRKREDARNSKKPGRLKWELYAGPGLLTGSPGSVWAWLDPFFARKAEEVTGKLNQATLQEVRKLDMSKALEYRFGQIRDYMAANLSSELEKKLGCELIDSALKHFFSTQLVTPEKIPEYIRTSSLQRNSIVNGCGFGQQEKNAYFSRKPKPVIVACPGFLIESGNEPGSWPKA